MCATPASVEGQDPSHQVRNGLRKRQHLKVAALLVQSSGADKPCPVVLPSALHAVLPQKAHHLITVLRFGSMTRRCAHKPAASARPWCEHGPFAGALDTARVLHQTECS